MRTTVGDPLFQAFRASGGYYRCPRNACNARVGPLVQYSQTYRDEKGEEKHLVGEVDFNFSYPPDLVQETLATVLAEKVIKHARGSGMPDAVVSVANTASQIPAPSLLARYLNCRHLTVYQKEKELVWVEVKVPSQSKLLFFTDVLEDSQELSAIDCFLRSSGARVSISCGTNALSSIRFNGEQILSLFNIPKCGYRHDDWIVQADVEKGNVCDPKIEWPRLAALMK